jgi:ubiquinone/menaquinone biosynthesis C-methylase UbiE
MSEPWNLTPDEWSNVLGTNEDIQKLAEELKKGKYLLWNEVLHQYTENSLKTLDLGSGRGENSAMLAMHKRETTLFDWSKKNLDFSKRLFEAINRKGNFIKGDITKPLPFEDSTFDTVFCCGVLEYFTDQQIKEILKEAFRVAQKRVIILVPNAYSFCYRLGMWYMKRTNNWPWGGERAFGTLKHCFKVIPDLHITEFSVGTKHSLNFLDSLPNGKLFHRALAKIFRLKDHSRPSFLNQGYLLITIGEKNEK